MTVASSYKRLKMFYRALALCSLIWLSQPVLADTIVQHTPPFVPTGMVAIGEDSLLLWRDDGQLQIRNTKGEWSAVLQLPMQKIMRIRAEDTGALVIGAPETPFGPSLILALDPAGKESERWLVAGAWDVAVTPHGRRAVTLTGLLPLLPNAAVGSEEPFPPWGGNRPAPRLPPKLLYWREATVFCSSADLSMQHFAHAHCERPGPGGWLYEYGETMPDPVACGPWLLVTEGKHLEQLTVLEMTTGKVLARRKFHSQPRIACAGEDQLAIGERNLELAQLPTLKTNWHVSIAKDRLFQLVALKDYLVYRTENNPDLLLMPRPAR